MLRLNVLTGKTLEHELIKTHVVLDRYRRERGYESIRRVGVPTREPEKRLKHPQTQVEVPYDREHVMREASRRCLDCGVTPVFDGNRCLLCCGCADVCPAFYPILEKVDEERQTMSQIDLDINAR